MKWMAALLFCLAGFSGCLQGDDALTDTDEVPSLDDETIRFIAIGDAGTGGEGQYQVAAAMETVCAQRGCDFALGLGDNIYEEGVSGPYDAQFEEKFEEPYANLSFPFYMVLGNHDNGGGYGYDASVGDHEVAYHHRTDRTSEKWQMPSRVYSFTEGPATFFGLDSGPMTINLLPVVVPGITGEDQAAWLADGLAASETPWNFAFAHHPYISNGQHGNAGTYDGIPGAGLGWKDVFQSAGCGRVDVFFAGHDHDLQWLEPAADCPGTHQIVSGAGGKQRSVRDADENPARFQAYDTYGFAWIHLTAQHMSVTFFDGDGVVLFEDQLDK